MSVDVRAAASARARRLYVSEGFQQAYVRGAVAASKGLPITACPYRQKPGGGWTAWTRSWRAGYRSVRIAD